MLIGLKSVCSELDSRYPTVCWRVTECLNPMEYGVTEADLVSFCTGKEVSVECDISQWVVLLPKSLRVEYNIPNGVLSINDKDVKLSKELQGVICEWILTGGETSTHHVGSLACLEKMNAVLGI